MEFLLNTDVALLVLRIAVGTIFIVHGAEKWKMWKAPAAQGSARKMTNLMKLLSVAEPLGGIAVVIGFLTKLASLGLGIVMVGAIAMKIAVWRKRFTGEGGWEMDFVLLAALIALLYAGAGTLSLDAAIFLLI